MSGWQIAAIGFGIFCFVCGVQIFARTEHPLRGGLGEILRGELALLAIGISGIWTGVTLPLSLVNAAFSALAGIPGVVAMLLVKLILPAVSY